MSNPRSTFLVTIACWQYEHPLGWERSFTVAVHRRACDEPG